MPQIRCEYSELVAIERLIPNPKNPNKHPPEQIKRLAKIIEYQGMRSPIVVSKQSGYITKGHGRLEALKLLGWTEVPVEYQHYDSSHMEYEDIVADNAIASYSKLDISMVNADMIELGPELNLEMLGLKGFKLEPAELPPRPESKDDKIEYLDASCPSCGHRFKMIKE